jgi:hypothetical protein
VGNSKISLDQKDHTQYAAKTYAQNYNFLLQFGDIMPFAKPQNEELYQANISTQQASVNSAKLLFYFLFEIYIRRYAIKVGQ